jgi:hypothetical protein
MFVSACKKWQISPFAFLSNLMGFCTSTIGKLQTALFQNVLFILGK